MCAYGPVVLGYRHPGVEAAAQRQAALGDCLNHPAAVMVELAERLVSLIDFAAWAVFGKNGSDMTTWCIQVAREYTGRSKILCVEDAYHGIDAWCTPGHGGLIEEDRAHVHRFRWNDYRELRRGDDALSEPGRGGSGDSLPPSPVCAFGNAGSRLPGTPPVAVHPPWRGAGPR